VASTKWQLEVLSQALKMACKWWPLINLAPLLIFDLGGQCLVHFFGILLLLLCCLLEWAICCKFYNFPQNRHSQIEVKQVAMSGR